MNFKLVLLACLAIGFVLAPFAGSENVVRADDAAWRAQPRITIVWPHDGQGNPTTADKSRMVNIGVWPSDQVSCAEPPENNGLWITRLLVAKGNEPTDYFPDDYRVVQRTVGSATFPSLEFDNIPADLVATPAAQYRFVLFTSGETPNRGFNSNVWSHAADPRTLLPQPFLPDGYSSSHDYPPGGTDARIQIVWPHDETGQFISVERATFVNIAVDLFQHDTRKSMPLDTQTAVLLFVAEENGQLRRADPLFANEQRITYTFHGQTYPRWVFNDVRVIPGEQYHFIAISVSPGAKLPSPHSTIWTHAPDARTFLPSPEPPPSCAP